MNTCTSSQRNNESGGTLVSALVFIVLLSIAIMVAMRIADSAKVRAKHYKRPANEIEFFFRNNLNCPATLTAIGAACTAGAPIRGKTAGGTNLSSATFDEYRDRDGKHLGNFRLTCVNRQRYALEFADRSNLSKWITLRYFQCP